MMQIMVVLFFLLMVIVVFYLVSSGILGRSNRSDDYENFFRVVKLNLKENLQKLENGDLGWRRLGHGQATIRLRKTIPNNAGTSDVSPDSVGGAYPDLIEQIKEIDAGIGRLAGAAKRLADKLEGPVRGKFQEDRHELTDRQDPDVLHFRKWLIDTEDAWMEVLANLVNNGGALDKKSDPGALYWQYAESEYKSILEKHGGREYRDLQQLRAKIAEQSRVLLAELEGDAGA